MRSTRAFTLALALTRTFTLALALTRTLTLALTRSPLCAPPPR